MCKCSVCGCFHVPSKNFEPFVDNCSLSHTISHVSRKQEASKLVSSKDCNDHYKERLASLPICYSPHNIKLVLKVLSVGCGDQSESQILRDLFPTKKIDYLGIDNKYSSIEKAKANNPGDEFSFCDITKIYQVRFSLISARFPSKVDVIIFRHPLIKIEWFKASMISIISECLAPGGIVFISNHYQDELKLSIDLLKSVSTGDIYRLPISNEAPYRKETISNYFEQPMSTVLYYDRCMLAILNHLPKLIEIKKEISPRFSPMVGGLGI